MGDIANTNYCFRFHVPDTFLLQFLTVLCLKEPQAEHEVRSNEQWFKADTGKQLFL